MNAQDILRIVCAPIHGVLRASTVDYLASPSDDARMLYRFMRILITAVGLSGCMTLPPNGLETGRVLSTADTAVVVGVGFGFGGPRQAPFWKPPADREAESEEDGGWKYFMEPMLFARYRAGLGAGVEVDVTGTLLIAGVGVGFGGHGGLKYNIGDGARASAAVGARAGVEVLAIMAGKGITVVRLLASPRLVGALHPDDASAIHAVPYGLYEYMISHNAHANATGTDGSFSFGLAAGGSRALKDDRVLWMEADVLYTPPQAPINDDAWRFVLVGASQTRG